MKRNHKRDKGVTNKADGVEVAAMQLQHDLVYPVKGCMFKKCLSNRQDERNDMHPCVRKPKEDRDRESRKGRASNDSTNAKEELVGFMPRELVGLTVAWQHRAQLSKVPSPKG